MRRIYFLIIVIIIILIAGGIYYVVKNWKPTGSDVEPFSVEDEITRQEVMKDASSVLGGNWYVTRFWFIQGSNKDFYIEYEDGHILRQILVEAEKNNGELDYKIIAYFEPGETSWQLKTGEDKFFGHLLDLYEYNEELKEWAKRN